MAPFWIVTQPAVNHMNQGAPFSQKVFFLTETGRNGITLNAHKSKTSIELQDLFAVPQRMERPTNYIGEVQAGNRDNDHDQRM